MINQPAESTVTENADGIIAARVNATDRPDLSASSDDSKYEASKSPAELI